MKCTRHFFLAILVSMSSVSVLAAESISNRTYPDDPFAQDRDLLPATEMGSGRGQAHLFMMGALVDGKNSNDIYLGGQLGIEFQLHEFGGIRISGFQDISESDFGTLKHKFSSVRVGPVLHLRPYRRVDFGIYSEGGVLVVDAVDGDSDAAPEITLGGFISVHLDSHTYLQLELEGAWSNVEVGGVMDDQNRTAAKLGFGSVF